MKLDLIQHPFDQAFEDATAEARKALRDFWLVYRHLAWMYK